MKVTGLARMTFWPCSSPRPTAADFSSLRMSMPADRAKQSMTMKPTCDGMTWCRTSRIVACERYTILQCTSCYGQDCRTAGLRWLTNSLRYFGCLQTVLNSVPAVRVVADVHTFACVCLLRGQIDKASKVSLPNNVAALKLISRASLLYALRLNSRYVSFSRI